MAVLRGEDIPAWLSAAYEVTISRWTHPRLTRLRTDLLRPHFGRLGPGSTISFGTRILEPGRIRVGARSTIPNTSVIDGRGGVTIGDDCLLGFENVLISSTHRSQRIDLPIREQGMYSAQITVGDDVWTGCRVIILPGVTVGSHAIVAAGSVVTRDVEPWSVVGGVPASFIRDRRA